MNLYDLKFAIRSAVRTPLFSLLAIVTLALGIGANAALFAVVKPVLLDLLPFAQHDRLVRTFAHNTETGEERWGLSAGMVDDRQRAQRSFSATAAFFSFPQGFVGPAGKTDVYMSLNLPAYLVNPMNARRSYNFGVLARLAPDVAPIVLAAGSLPALAAASTIPMTVLRED